MRRTTIFLFLLVIHILTNIGPHTAPYNTIRLILPLLQEATSWDRKDKMDPKVLDSVKETLRKIEINTFIDGLRLMERDDPTPIKTTS